MYDLSGKMSHVHLRRLCILLLGRVSCIYLLDLVGLLCYISPLLSGCSIILSGVLKSPMILFISLFSFVSWWTVVRCVNVFNCCIFLLFEPFINISFSCSFFYLKSILSDISMATLVFFGYSLQRISFSILSLSTSGGTAVIVLFVFYMPYSVLSFLYCIILFFCVQFNFCSEVFKSFLFSFCMYSKLFSL